MSLSTDETYIETYQKYLKQKGNSSEDLNKLKISRTASTKVLKPALPEKDCKICRVLSKPGDLCRVLNQGLFHKYTSSQDYFYTRDINTLLSKKRKAFSVRYHDDLIYDECKERLKGYFKRKDSVSLMSEIKQFYTKFKNFPRNFHTNFFHIINSNIRKHRRIEYMRVFHGANLDEDKAADDNDQPDQKDTSKNGREPQEFHLMELLGDSFLKDNYKDISDVAIGGVKLDKPKDTARSIQEIEENFKALYKSSGSNVSDPNSAVFSNALYNKNFMLYSRSDSQTAEDILKQIVNEFKEADLGNKASMTLAEKVLHQVASASAAATGGKKQENRYSPTLKQRTGGAFEFSPLIQGNRRPLGSSTTNLMTPSMQQQQPTVKSSVNTSTRGQSNPRNNSRGEDTGNILGKVNQSKLYEQRKSTEKFSVEHLNDIVINRNKIMSTLYQFRSTRSKSGGLKSVASTSKTPSYKNGFPLGVVGEPKSSELQDSRQAITGNIHEKSPSPSPERRASKEDSRPVGEMMVKVRPNLELSTYSTIKRSASQGINGEFRELGSPMLSQISQSTQHKKASSVIKRRGTATPIKRGVNPSVQNYTLNNNSSINNMSNSHQDTTVSPNHGKFINPLRQSLGNTQNYYFRHQSPMEDKIQQVSGVYHSEPNVKNLNIRSMKQAGPNRTDNNYRANTLSLSGRQQNLLDLSQGVSSYAVSQTSGQLNRTNPEQMKVKKIEKASMQAFAAKIIKRASLAPNQIITPVLELEEKEKKPRKVLELSETNYNAFRDLKLPSKEQTPVNLGIASSSSLNKFKVEVKKNTWSSYTMKGGSKDPNIRLTLKK